MDVGKIFEIERDGRVTILNLRRCVEEIEFDQPPMDAEVLLERVRRGQMLRIIVDCHEIDFLRSTALGFFVTLWKRVQNRGGKVVFCNVTDKVRAILRATKLDSLWTIVATRADAAAALECQPPGPASDDANDE
jgi:anti-anti-sigma factor